jgi:hypothetical protein
MQIASMHVARAGPISESLVLDTLPDFHNNLTFRLCTAVSHRRATMATLGDQAVGGVLMLVGLFIWLYYTAWTIVTVS